MPPNCSDPLADTLGLQLDVLVVVESFAHGRHSFASVAFGLSASPRRRGLKGRTVRGSLANSQIIAQPPRGHPTCSPFFKFSRGKMPFDPEMAFPSSLRAEVAFSLRPSTGALPYHFCLQLASTLQNGQMGELSMSFNAQKARDAGRESVAGPKGREQGKVRSATAPWRRSGRPNGRRRCTRRDSVPCWCWGSAMERLPTMEPGQVQPGNGHVVGVQRMHVLVAHLTAHGVGGTSAA